MIKTTKKSIIIIMTILTGLVGTVYFGANYLTNLQIPIKNKTYVLNRNNSFRHFSLVNKLNNNKNLSNLVTYSLTIEENNYTFRFDDLNFEKNIINLIRDCLKTIPNFSQNCLDYKIDCHYQFTNKIILIDVVWYLPNSDIKFYDQFKIVLIDT